MLPILIPLFISAFRRADELALPWKPAVTAAEKDAPVCTNWCIKPAILLPGNNSAFNCRFGSNALGAGLMMRTFKLTVAYDAAVIMLQRQPRDITVQQVLEDALSRITGEM